jgi:hypothetical protein
MKLPWHWQACATSPEPQAAWAVGDAAWRLLTKISAWDAPALQGLQATACQDMLVVLGPMAQLPWVDGVAYAAPSAQAPLLWLPTTHEPNVPHDLLFSALFGAHGREPVFLCKTRHAVVPLDRQQSLTPQWLEQVVQKWQDLTL